MQLRCISCFSKISVMGSRPRGIACVFFGLLGLDTAQRRCQYCAGHRAETDRGAFL